jgi:hypothetical protein
VLALAALRQTLVQCQKLAADDPSLRVLLADALHQQKTFAKARLARVITSMAVQN